MKKIVKSAMAFLLLAALIIGCGEEIESPLSADTNKGQLVSKRDTFMETIGDLTSKYYHVYLPPGYDANRVLGYNTLYLLNGFGGDEDYFTDLFSVIDAADDLYESNEIYDMIIVLPSGYSPLGGSFYVNSAHPAVGNSMTHLLDIVEEVDADFNTVGSPSGRAIGGVSMGGFGAVNAVLSNPNYFNYVSAHGAPLALHGTYPLGDSITYSGIEELLPFILAETGFDPGHSQVDSLYTYSMYPAPNRRLTSMLFAMAAAFSPTPAPGGVPQVTETTIRYLYTPSSSGEIVDSTLLFVDLPIGKDGQLKADVFARWMNFDPVSRILATGGQIGGLPNAKLYLDVGLDDDLGLYGAHQVLDGALAAVAMPADTSMYYDGVNVNFGMELPAGHVTQVYERLKKLLIWHNEKFQSL